MNILKFIRETLAKIILSLLTFTSLVLASGLSAGAQPYSYYPTVIELNGQSAATPKHIVAVDPFSGKGSQPTSYLPIWYLFQVLHALGITPTWDGHTLNLDVLSSISINYPSIPSPMDANNSVMAVTVNGRTVVYAPKIAYTDEGSTTMTTFIPVYYVEKVLGYLNIQTGWNGTNWTMSSGPSQKPLSNYQADDQYAYQIVKEISADKYQGRKPGTLGYTAAANYIAGQFQTLGLTPVGDKGTFLQAYAVGLAQFNSMPTLNINGQSLQFMKNFKVHGMSQSGTLTGSQVVYVQNGYPENYQGTDVAGKIVVFSEDTTPAGSMNGVIDRAEYAKKQGASGVLIIAGSMYPIGSFERPLLNDNSGVLALYIAQGVAQTMGINLQSTLPQTLSVQVSGTIPIKRTPNQTAYNVLGMIKGQDPTKTIILEANLDGFGSLPDGTVFPGASADASGVGDLVGLAEYYRSLKTKPAVNILFALFGSETERREGSIYFLKHDQNLWAKSSLTSTCTMSVVSRCQMGCTQQ